MKELILNEVKNILINEYNINENRIITTSKFIEDLHIDYLPIFDLMILLAEKYNIEVSPDDIDKIVTVGDAVNLITNREEFNVF